MKDYKKILEGVVNIINTTEKSDIGFANICTYIGENCPELKESEGERIRTRLIDYFSGFYDRFATDRNHTDVHWEGLEVKKVLAWLEKKGETFTKKDVDDAYLKGISNAKQELEKQSEQKLTVPKWRYKNDNTPLLRDSLILNKYGCVGKSPSGALVNDVWVMDYGELAKLPKEEIEKQGEQKPAENFIETWKDMRLEVYQQASGNRKEPNYSDDTTKMFSLNDIDEIIEKMSEQKSACMEE